MRTGKTIISIVVMAMAFLLTSCNDSAEYNNYVSISEDGWDKRDSLTFGVDTIKMDGQYTTTLCLRTNSQYPYRYLYLDTRVKTYPQNTVTVRNIRVEMRQENGVPTGKGITYYTYEIPVMTQELRKGDSICVVVNHHMRREYMPGITDVGIKVERR